MDETPLSFGRVGDSQGLPLLVIASEGYKILEDHKKKGRLKRWQVSSDALTSSKFYTLSYHLWKLKHNKRETES